MKNIISYCICILLVLLLSGCVGPKAVPSEITWKPEDSSFIDETHMLRIAAHWVKGSRYVDGPYIIISLPGHLSVGFESFNNMSSATANLEPVHIAQLVNRAGINEDQTLNLDYLRGQKMECDEASQTCVSRVQFSNQVRSAHFLPGKENGLQMYLIVFEEENTVTQVYEILPDNMGKK